jgi:hypothetical protein
MTWDNVLDGIAKKHKISLKTCSSTQEKETRIQEYLEPARFQQYRLKYFYRPDKWTEVKSPD